MQLIKYNSDLPVYKNKHKQKTIRYELKNFFETGYGINYSLRSRDSIMCFAIWQVHLCCPMTHCVRWGFWPPVEGEIWFKHNT